MTATPSVKLRLYVALTGLGAVCSLAFGRAELVALCAPFAVYVVVGLALGQRPRVGIESANERLRVLEGEEFGVSVVLTADSDVTLQLNAAVATPGTRKLSMRAGERRELRLGAHAERWGVFALGSLACRARDRFALIDYRLAPVALGNVRVFPRLETLRALVEPLELQARSGSRVARDRGEGTEFAEVRSFVPGDRLRRVNWRATARRGAPYVSDRHPERNADVILFLDTFAHAGDTLVHAVRAAASIAAAQLALKDRVGVIGFGGVLSGLGPKMGSRQLYRILDVLLGSEVVFSYAHKDVSFVPRGLLPPKAFVIGITPLIDERYVGALIDLRARGFDVAVLDVSPVPFVGSADPLAQRLWLLRREAVRARLRELGAPVVEWRADEPLQLPLASAAALRRRSRYRVAA